MSATLVTINGYSGSAEDPQISPDGQYLFFDNHSPAASAPIQLFYAHRYNFNQFNFIGPVPGLPTTGITLKGNYDTSGRFYFTRPEDIGVGTGPFRAGAVGATQPVTGLSQAPPPPGYMNLILDACCSTDGQFLFESQAVTMGPGGPVSSFIAVGQYVAPAIFQPTPPLEAIVAPINAVGIVYNSAPSPNGLVFAFTVNVPNASPQIWTATRTSTSAPFSVIGQWTDTATVPGNFSESGGWSTDGYFYFHRNISTTLSQIYVLPTLAARGSFPPGQPYFSGG